MASGVYQILNTVNGKRYIGQASNLKKRQQQHMCDLRTGRHTGTKLQRAFTKHGEDAFEFKVLLICTPEMLTFYEDRCIVGFDTIINGYNICPAGGSSLGVKRSAETCRRIGAAKVGNQYRLGSRQSAETKEKISALKKGKQPWLGRKHAEEAKIKMSESKKGQVGHVLSPETCAKISASKLGKLRSLETVQKMVLALSPVYTYREETLTAREWATKLNRSYKGFRCRISKYAGNPDEIFIPKKCSSTPRTRVSDLQPSTLITNENVVDNQIQKKEKS